MHVASLRHPTYPGIYHLSSKDTDGTFRDTRPWQTRAREFGCYLSYFTCSNQTVPQQVNNASNYLIVFMYFV